MRTTLFTLGLTDRKAKKQDYKRVKWQRLELILEMKRNTINKEVKEQETQEKIEVIPEHIEVRQSGEHLKFNTVP